MWYICFDIGDKRTGVAVGSDEVGFATPVDVFESSAADRLPARMAALAEEHGAAVIVIGLPLNMDGTEGPRARAVREIAAKLAEHTTRRIDLYDERLTSFAAEQHLGGTGLSYKRKKERRDAVAAATILQDYLNARRAETGDRKS